MMDAGIKERWINRLRNGNLRQVDGVLKDDRDHDGRLGYCCLGVLCELAVEDGAIPEAKPLLETDQYTAEDREIASDSGGEGFPTQYAYPDKDRDGFQWQTEVLPLAVREWAGLSEPNPTIMVTESQFYDWDPEEDEGDDDIATELATLNDENKWTFAQIADAIEKDGAL